MKCVFVDNFRGFKQTLLPLRDVNFFVGENSTGKTSLLSLVYLLSSPTFWTFGASTAFNSEEVRLGNFKDIVSANADDKSYFRIGFSTGPEGAGENSESRSCLITFGEREGMPIITHYTTRKAGADIHAELGSKIRLKLDKTPRAPIESLSATKEVFSAWAVEHGKKSSGYKTSISLPSQLSQTLGVVNAILARAVMPKEKRMVEARSVTLPFDVFPPFAQAATLAPIRTRPKRTYDEYNIEFSPEGEHTPYLIKKFLGSKRKKEEFLRFIGRFGEDSGLFAKVDVRNFGRAAIGPFELDVTIDGARLNIVNVGYGVSQVLPIAAEIFARAKTTCFLIQQPEVHLHPRAQAALGTLFYNVAQSEQKSLIIETHSDFIIDSYRLACRDDSAGKKPEAQIVYFERSERGNELYPIEILKNGELSEDQPSGYRDFFIKEQMHILGY